MSRHRVDDDEAAKIAASGESQRAAAARLGVSKSAVQRALRRIQGPATPPLPEVPDGYGVSKITSSVGPDGELRAQSIQARPFNPDAHEDPSPPGWRDKFRTTLTDAAGNVVLQYRRTEPGQPSREEIMERLAREFEGVPARPAEPISEPARFHSDLLAVYPIGDAHIGMRNPEGFNLARNVELHKDAIDHLVLQGPRTERAIVANLADFFHSDDPSNRTRKSGHILDVDGMWFEILKAGRDLFVYMIQRALAHHREVHVKCLIGNHDDLSAVFLALLVDAHFREEPRVTVDVSGKRVQWFEWGANLLGFTHGNQPKSFKPGLLAQVMSTRQPVAWGRTRHRYWYTGHVHHTRRIEEGGCTIESFRVLAPRDEWHEDEGYTAGRDMTRIVLHRARGEVSRATACAEMFEDVDP